MAYHIKPCSITSYLSGICSSLEPYFPSVWSIQNSALVSHTLAGVKKLQGGSDPKGKRPLTEQDLSTVLKNFNSGSFNDLLFNVILLTAFQALM